MGCFRGKIYSRSSKLFFVFGTSCSPCRPLYLRRGGPNSLSLFFWPVAISSGSSLAFMSFLTVWASFFLVNYVSFYLSSKLRNCVDWVRGFSPGDPTRESAPLDLITSSMGSVFDASNMSELIWPESILICHLSIGSIFIPVTSSSCLFLTFVANSSLEVWLRFYIACVWFFFTTRLSYITAVGFLQFFHPLAFLNLRTDIIEDKIILHLFLLKLSSKINLGNIWENEQFMVVIYFVRH